MPAFQLQTTQLEWPHVEGKSAPYKRNAILACLLLCLFSLFVFALNASHGIGIFTDSTRYMGISERVYDAPVYPWLLYTGSALGLDLTVVATSIAVVVLCINVSMLFWLLLRATESLSYAVAGTALIIVSPQFVILHASAMSEPPFLAFLLLTLVATLNYWSTENRLWLLLSAVALGIATLTRFTAPPLGAALAIAYLVNQRFPFSRRLSDVLVLGGISASIFMAWVAISQVTAGRSIGRDLWFYGNFGVREWLTGLNSMTAWILPDEVPFLFRVAALLVILVVGTILTVRQIRLALVKPAHATQYADLLPLVLSLFFLFYIGFVALSVAIEANLSFNSRYAFPAYVALVLLLVCVTGQFRNQTTKLRWLHAGLVGIAALTLISHSARTSVRTYEAYREGIGYRNVLWTKSPTIAAIKTLPTSATIYSNGPDIITFLTGRKAHFSPHTKLLRTNLPDPENPVADQLARLIERSQKEQVYIVLFDNVDWRFYLMSEEELKTKLSLKLEHQAPDGRIYSLKHEPSEAALTHGAERSHL